MKRVLILTSVASMIDQFNIPNIELLQSMGYSVEVACNFKEGSTCTKEKIEKLKQKLKKKRVTCYQIDFDRSVTRLTQNIKAFWQVEYLLETNHYEFLHCHSPIGGVVGRIAGKLKKTKVIYTAHGFHFYKGGPRKNWIIYYPIEKLCSYMTDVLITINKEDYALAKKKMKAKKIIYMPGVGIDITKFQWEKSQKDKMQLKKVQQTRKKIGYTENKILLLSVGELNKNKNHELVIRTLARMNNHNFYYVIVGIGELFDYLKDLSEELQVDKQIHFCGFCEEVGELYRSADIFIFPSLREGLPVALMEAMASGLPIIAGRIRGNVDLLDESGGQLFDPHSIEECQRAIQKLKEKDLECMGKYNIKKIKQFSIDRVMKYTKKIYEELTHENLP